MDKDKKISTELEADQAELAELLGAAIAPLDVPGVRRERLRGRLLERVAASAARHARTICVRMSDGFWRKLKNGVEVKALHAGASGNSVLIRMAAGSALPVHRHRWLEEGIILDGSFRIEGQDLKPGDYHVSPAGSLHGKITSPEGGFAYLRGTAIGNKEAMARELLGGLLPFGARQAITVTADRFDWKPLAQGVDAHVVWSEGASESRFVRLAPGASWQPPAGAGDAEVIVVSGEAFVGDLLLRHGDFALEPAGGTIGRISSDVGCVLFLRGPAA